MTTSRELYAFKKHFEEKTGINVQSVIEDRQFYHWKRLVLKELNCEQLRTLSFYISSTFSEQPLHSHLLPKLGTFNAVLCLTVSDEQIRKFILK